MTRVLRFIDRPAGEIVETREDGSALRNDGVKLRPARENPWYRLATLFGEDADAHEKNRDAWNFLTNTYFNGGSPTWKVHRASVNVAFNPTAVDALQKADEVFEGEFPGDFVPGAASFIDFRRTLFVNKLNLGGFRFPRRVLFTKSVFEDAVDVSHADFSETVNFSDVHAAKGFLFNWASVGRSATFKQMTFGDYARFQHSIFKFAADFELATFTASANFSDTEFKGKTNFGGVHFRSQVPKLFQANLHQDTRFTCRPELWPDAKKETAQDGIESYTRLRQIMSDLHKPEEEQFFFRQEMRCKEKTGGFWERLPIRAYGWVSDFGHSIERPVAGLALVWALYFAVFAVFFASPLNKEAGLAGLPFAAALSFANMFSFLGFKSAYLRDEIALMPDWVHGLCGSETVLGFVLLFFLGLGLRNRFRLR